MQMTENLVVFQLWLWRISRYSKIFRFNTFNMTSMYAGDKIRDSNSKLFQPPSSDESIRTKFLAFFAEKLGQYWPFVNLLLCKTI